MATFEVDARDMVRERMSLAVSLGRCNQLKIRFWLGFHLLRLVAWVMWIDNIEIVEIVTENNES